ncbi:hypothetical protein KKF45_04725 [Patescibacteria group bacterium]|nr:hypothetical protein [Patescibacteria group bacterium]
MPWVRRVLFKDYVYEDVGNANGQPYRWGKNINSANWVVAVPSITGGGNNIIYNLGIVGQIVAPAERGTLRGTITQNLRLYYDYTIRYVGIAGVAGTTDFIFFASASTGEYLGNSYVYRCTPANSTLYESTGNVLTTLSDVANAHANDTNYAVEIDYNPFTGLFTIKENGVTKISYTDTTPITSGNYIGFNATSVAEETYLGLIRIRRPPEETLMSSKVFHRLTKGVSSFTFRVSKPDDVGTAVEWKQNDGVEIFLRDGTTDVLDFYGRVESVDDRGDTGAVEISGTDWRSEGLNAEDNYSGTALISNIIKTLIRNKLRVLGDSGVKATIETPVARTLQSKYVYDAIVDLAQEAGYAIWQTPKGELAITDVFPASGVAMTGEEIYSYHQDEDTVDMVTGVKVAYAGGGSYTLEDQTAASYASYGRHEKVIVDKTIPDSTQAAARANYFINRYRALRKIVDVWCTDFHELYVGQTGTITLGQLGFSASEFVCTEKEYDFPDMPGFRFRLSIGASPAVEKHKTDLPDKLGKLANQMQQSLVHGVAKLTTTDLSDGILSADATGRAKMANDFITDVKMGFYTWKVIGDYTVPSPSPISSYTFPALNGDVDAVYRIVCRFNNANTVSDVVRVRPNADALNSYNTQLITFTGAGNAVGYQETGVNYGLVLCRGDIGSYTAGIADMILFATTGYKRMACTISGSGNYGLNGIVEWTNTTTNIASLEIRMGGAYIGVGSRFILMKLR